MTGVNEEQKMESVYALTTPSTSPSSFFNLTVGSLDEEGDGVGELLSVNGSGVPGNDSDYVWDADDLLYRHSLEIAVLLCFSYVVVFVLGLVGNCFVIAVVFRYVMTCVVMLVVVVVGNGSDCDTGTGVFYSFLLCLSHISKLETQRKNWKNN